MVLAGARILVVDDNVELSENVGEILEAEGAEVRRARTGAEALEIARSPLDVVLLDVRLPDVSGVTLLPRLKTGEQPPEVLLVTGNGSLEDAMEAVSGGAYAYVLKPFDPTRLVADVSRALRQVRSTRESDALRAALEHSEGELRTLVDTVQALLLVLDDDGRVIQANQAVAATTGTAVDEIPGSPWIERFVAERDREPSQAVLERLLEGEPWVSHEDRVLRRLDDGGMEERWVRWRSSMLEDGGGRRRIYASGLDLTRRHELERRARLSEKLAAVGTLSAGLAHEIRNPLNAASLQLRVMERRLKRGRHDEASLGEPLGLVQAELDRLSRLVTEFLEFARPKHIERARIDLAELVGRTLELEGPAAAEQDVTLARADDGTPVPIEGDLEKLGQVLLNLVRNAVEAAGPGGRVEIGAAREGDGGRLWIHDDGPGIPERDLSRVFEPFYSTKAGGTGLGMSIVHSLVTLHGGDIGVDLDGGTRVVVTLPGAPP